MRNKKKLAEGGTLDYAGIAALLSQITDAAGQRENGMQTNTSAAASGALKGAGVGAKLGSVVPGIGTAIGGGVGAIVGGITSLRRNKKVLEDFSVLKTKEGEGRSRMLNQLQDAKLANYDQGTEYQSFYAKGGRLRTGDPLVPGVYLPTVTDPRLNTHTATPIIPTDPLTGLPVNDSGLQRLKLAQEMNIKVDNNQIIKRVRRDKPFIERANGGKLPFQLLNSGAVKVKGAKHEQGGVKIGRNVEVEGGEVIHGDKVYSDRLKVPGGRRTYADEAQRITGSPMYRTLGKKIRGLDKGDSNLKMNMYQSGTMVRNLQKTLNPLEALFNLQEVHKMKSGIGGGRKMAYGGNLYDETPIQKGVSGVANYLRKNKKNLIGLGLSPEQRAAQEQAMLAEQRNKEYDKRAVDNGLLGNDSVENAATPDPVLYSAGINGALAGAKFGAKPRVNPVEGSSFTGKQLLNKVGELVPYADNLVNAVLTQKSPQVPVPTLEVAPTLKTKFNIQPQLGEIARNNNAANRTLRDNVSDGASLRGSLLAQNINSVSARNALLGQKENVETELVNKQAALSADTANRNASTMNAYDLRKFGRNADKQTRISQNIANLVEDVQQQQIDKKLDINDETNLALVLKKYEKSGVLNRLEISRILANTRKGMTAEKAIELAKKN